MTQAAMAETAARVVLMQTVYAEDGLYGRPENPDSLHRANI
jgi:hypothetical protein